MAIPPARTEPSGHPCRHSFPSQPLLPTPPSSSQSLCSCFQICWQRCAVDCDSMTLHPGDKNRRENDNQDCSTRPDTQNHRKTDSQILRGTDHQTRVPKLWRYLGLASFLFFTPIAFTAITFCIKATFNQSSGDKSLLSTLENITLLILIPALLIIYLLWCFVLIRCHFRQCLPFFSLKNHDTSTTDPENVCPREQSPSIKLYTCKYEPSEQQGISRFATMPINVSHWGAKDTGASFSKKINKKSDQENCELSNSSPLYYLSLTDLGKCRLQEGWHIVKDGSTRILCPTSAPPIVLHEGEIPPMLTHPSRHHRHRSRRREGARGSLSELVKDLRLAQRANNSQPVTSPTSLNSIDKNPPGLVQFREQLISCLVEVEQHRHPSTSPHSPPNREGKLAEEEHGCREITPTPVNPLLLSSTSATTFYEHKEESQDTV